MNAENKTSGFTVIELLLGVIASAILALGVGAMLYYGWVSWIRNNETVKMQRNAMIAMRVIEHRIRNAGQGKISWTADEINFNDAQIGDFSKSEIIPGSDVLLSNFDVHTNTAGGVVVAFDLETRSRTATERFEMTVYPRN